MANRKGLLQYFGIKHHEYWPWWLLVIPIWPLWFWYGLLLRKMTWFTAVNTNIEDSGFVQESKMEILKNIPATYLPKTYFIDFEKPLPLIQIEFPLIAKPDIGGRGRKIEIIHSDTELNNYHASISENYLIQEFVESNLEFGIFYVKTPSMKQGKVVSVAQKKFLELVGDGVHNIEELMNMDYRAQLQIERLRPYINMQRILDKGVQKIIEPIGNHCRGTQFVNRNDLINEQMHQTFNTISQEIDGFFYGRFDLKVFNISDLYQGNAIKILELNGLTSDVAHLFDPHTRLRDVFFTQVKHCKYCYEIAKENLKKGYNPTPPLVLLKKIISFLKSD
ncbi:MAG: hypothetical protein R2831_08070 [Chitinophagaceae bacterium]